MNNSELVRFVLNRQEKWLPRWVRFYVALTEANRSRQSAVSAQLNMGGPGTRLFSEISFPPFTYVMTLDSDPPDKRLVDISYFGDRGYQEWADVPLRLPILPIYSFFPGDYRDRDGVNRDYLANTKKPSS